jgi:hypothetical protein
MTNAAPAAKAGCFKRGCFGCLGVVGVLLILIMGWALITVVRGTPDVVRETNQVTHVIPPHTDSIQDSSEPLIVDVGQMGRIVLDVSMATFKIVPEPPGTPMRLEANYDSGSYKLEETFEPSGELGWTYRLEFGKRSSFQFFHVNPDNRLELHVPAGTPLTLGGELGIGQSRLDLGGLWIESVDLETGIGEHVIDFSEPLSSPMASFELDASIGEVRVRRLGNASPASARVDHSIGEISVDLRGAWQNDSDVFVASSIGECRINLPSDRIGLELIGARVTLGESDSRRAHTRGEIPEGAPLIRLTARHTLGELRLTD